MNVRDLTPWRRAERDTGLPARFDEAAPFQTLHRQMNRLFDDLLRGFDSPAVGLAPIGGLAPAWPSLELQESDTDYRVTAELPGLAEKDVEVLIEDGVLTLRGEKRVEIDDPARAYSERAYGRFSRQLRLGEIDEDRIVARFQDGLLTITVPKAKGAAERSRRIPINGPREGSTASH
jgi:HSP20 family protein